MSAAPVSPNYVEETQASTTEVPSCDTNGNQELPFGEEKVDQRPQYSSINESIDQTIPRSLNEKQRSKILEGSSLEQANQEENLHSQKCTLVEDTVQELPIIISEESAIKDQTSPSDDEEIKALGKVSPTIAQVSVADEAVEGVRSQQDQQNQPSEEWPFPGVNDKGCEKPGRQNLDKSLDGEKTGIPFWPHMIPQRQQSSLEGRLPKQDVPPKHLEALDEKSEDRWPSRSMDKVKSSKQGSKSIETDNEVYIGLATDRFKDNWYKKDTWNVNTKNEEDIWSEHSWKEKSKPLPKQTKRKGSRSADFSNPHSSNIKSPRKCDFNVCWDYINDPSGCRRGQNCTWKHARPGQKHWNVSQSQVEREAHTARRQNSWTAMRKKSPDINSQGFTDQHPSEKKNLKLKFLQSSIEDLKKRNVELVKRNYSLDCENKELKGREKGKEKVIEELRKENQNLKRLLKERERPRSSLKSYEYGSNPRSPRMHYSHPPRRLLRSKDRRFHSMEANPPINDRRHFIQPLPPQEPGMWSGSPRAYNPRYIPSCAPRPHDPRDWPYRKSTEGARYHHPKSPSFVEGGLVRSQMDPRSPGRDLEGCYTNPMPRHREPRYFPNRVSNAPLVRETYVEENHPAHPQHHSFSPSSNASPPHPHGWGNP